MNQIPAKREKKTKKRALDLQSGWVFCFLKRGGYGLVHGALSVRCVRASLMMSCSLSLCGHGWMVCLRVSSVLLSTGLSCGVLSRGDLLVIGVEDWSNNAMGVHLTRGGSPSGETPTGSTPYLMTFQKIE